MNYVDWAINELILLKKYINATVEKDESVDDDTLTFIHERDELIQCTIDYFNVLKHTTAFENNPNYIAHLFESIFNHAVLTELEGSDDEWEENRNKRYPYLYKEKIGEDEILVDMLRVYLYNEESGKDKAINAPEEIAVAVNKLYPITFPYYPPKNKVFIKVKGYKKGNTIYTCLDSSDELPEFEPMYFKMNKDEEDNIIFNSMTHEDFFKEFAEGAL